MVTHFTRLFVALLLSSLLLSQAAVAQKENEERVPVRASGKVKDFQRDIVHVVAGNGDQYFVKLPERSQNITFSASAKPDWLRPGMYVQFIGRFDEKGHSQQPITRLSVFTPGPDDKPGVFPEADFGDIKALFSRDEEEQKKAEPKGTSLKVVGRLAGLRKGKIGVSVPGASIEATLADNAQITVETSDLRLMREGDSISIEGWHLPGEEKSVYASNVKVTSAEPLSFQTKKRPQSADRKEIVKE